MSYKHGSDSRSFRRFETDVFSVYRVGCNIHIQRDDMRSVVHKVDANTMEKYDSC